MSMPVLSEGSKNTEKRGHSRKTRNRILKSPPIHQSSRFAINDLDPKKWKDYGDIITDSLWIFRRRDNSGSHKGDYWGNFVPQIPQQLLARYSRRDDWVLDPFAGSGTTLIECSRQGRNAIGIDISNDAVRNFTSYFDNPLSKSGVRIAYLQGDSTSLDFPKLISEYGINAVQLVILHPPYWDILKFTSEKSDLSNSDSLETFLNRLTEVARRCSLVLEEGRMMALVIGDKYSRGQWIPLGFYAMSRMISLGYILKSIVVKNFEETRGKNQQKSLWRYRALKGGYYIFKHEYIFIFQKIPSALKRMK